jgi:hypothetical protein
MLGGAALMAFTANAQTVLYGNLNATIGTYFQVSSKGPLYNSFSTGTAGLLLTDVKVYLDLADSPIGTVTVGLFSDSSIFPGSQIKVLATINDSSVVSNGGVFDIPVNPGIALAANTRYWIGMTASGSAIQWASTFTTTGTGNIANEYNCSAVISGGGGQTGSTSPRSARPHGTISTTACFSNVNDPFLMQVTAGAAPASAAAVPALSFYGMTLLTLLLAASAVIFMRRAHSSAS